MPSRTTYPSSVLSPREKGRLSQADRRTIEILLFSPPQRAGLPFLQHICKMLFKKSCSKITRGGVRKRICFQQPQHGRRTLKQPREKIHEPSLSLDVIQRCKPHLPIQPWLMRGNDGRSTLRVAYLVLAFVRLPAPSILASLDDDFGASLGHDSKQPVTVERTEWLEISVRNGKQRRPIGLGK